MSTRLNQCLGNLSTAKRSLAILRTRHVKLEDNVEALKRELERTSIALDASQKELNKLRYGEGERKRQRIEVDESMEQFKEELESLLGEEQLETAMERMSIEEEF